MRLALCVALAGCGRFGFDPLALRDATLVTDAPCTAWSTFSTPVALPGPVQSTVDDWIPTPTAGGTELYFHTFRAGTNARIFHAGRPTVADPFGVASQVVEITNSGSQQFSPTATADNLVLIFGDSKTGSFKLFATSRSSTGVPFDPPSALTAVNGSNTIDDNYPWISADGLRLVFASSRLGGGQNRLFETTRPDRTSPFSTPVELAALSAPSSETWSATLSADALDIFFASRIASMMTGFDVYTSHRVAVDQPFAPPVIVPELTSPRDDLGLRLTPDGATIYLSYNTVTAGNMNADLDIATRTCN